MRQSGSAPFGIILAWSVVAACSESPDRPPELGKCEFEDGSCPASIAGGGTSGGEDAGVVSPSACSVNPSDSQCTQCANASCCTSLSTCDNDTNCQNLYDCEQTTCASGMLDCINSCESMSPAGVSLLQNLTTCIQAKCPVCSQLGVGDPCSTFGISCNAGLVCTGLWCTKACVHSTDCVGLGAGGGNTEGLANACIASSAGEQCQPGCTQDADCSGFPGAYCFATTSTDGISVHVCVPPPDAGGGD